jgi:hypothetical protein
LAAVEEKSSAGVLPVEFFAAPFQAIAAPRKLARPAIVD